MSEIQPSETPKTVAVKFRVSLAGTLHHLVTDVLEPDEKHPPGLWALEQLRKHLAEVKRRHDLGESAEVLTELFDLYVGLEGCVFCSSTGWMQTRRELPEDPEEAATWRRAPFNWHDFMYLRPCVEGCKPPAAEPTP